MENNQLLKQKLKKIKEMVTIITTNTNEFKTALLLSEYYTSSKKFETAYASVIRKAKINEEYQEYVPLITRVGKIISKYEENKIFASINYYLNFRYYFENYDYSKFVIKYFLASSKIDLLDICEEIGINETIFNTCLAVVKELDPNLYQEYENKVYQNKIKRYEITKRKIENLYKSINESKENNTEFSKFDFLINMPFAKKEKSRQSFFELRQVNPNIKTIPLTIYGKILEFAQAEMPEMVSTLKEYMMENGLYRIPEFTKKELKKTYFLDSYTIINEQGENVTLTKEKINAIIDYMEEMNYPFITEIFIELQKRYVDNSLTIENNSSKKLVKTLIP